MVHGLDWILKNNGKNVMRNKIIWDIAVLDQFVWIFRRMFPDKKIVFTNGCFDLLHAGHIALFEFCKQRGDILIVGLNTDNSIKSLKPSRPILHGQHRQKMVASIECVDVVVPFSDPTPLELIRTIRPDALIKGGDYVVTEIVGREFVESYGGIVDICPVINNISTTTIVNAIKNGDVIR